MKKWEYFQVEEFMNADKLNSFGLEGWELVGFDCPVVDVETYSNSNNINLANNYIYIFKRPIVE